jgi:hypothetical protein
MKTTVKTYKNQRDRDNGIAWMKLLGWQVESLTDEQGGFRKTRTIAGAGTGGCLFGPLGLLFGGLLGAGRKPPKWHVVFRKQ